MIDSPCASSPLVSVIILTYNQKNYIERTVKSVLAQECPFEIEIIIGDDCSTDGTSDICRRLAADNPNAIHLIVNEKNKGLQDNYFDCVLMARGKYIADCGGDDFWIDPLKLSKQVAILEADPEVALVHTNWNYYDEPTGRTERSDLRHPVLLEYRKRLADKGELLLPVLSTNGMVVIHSCTWLYRRDLFLECYDEDTEMFRNHDFCCEDRQTTASLVRAGKVAYIDDVTLNYSVGKPSVSTSSSAAKQYRFYLGTTRLTRYIQQKFGIADADLRVFYTERLRYLMGMAFKMRSRGAASTVSRLAREWGVRLPLVSRVKLLLSKVL